MATSARYNTLVARTTQLEGHLLPAINLTGSYTPQDQDMIRSYCLLCHAEIEAYLEDYTTEIIDRAYNKWNANKAMISPIIFHLAFSYNGKKDLPYSMVAKSYNNLKDVIKSNNGVKENSLINFFRPIGFDVDPLLKTTLNNFGKNRGDIAHQSFQTQTPLDPATEKANVVLILNGLATLDEELNNYEITGAVSRVPTFLTWDKFSLIERLKILFTGRC
ncbi:hypothetical protein GCM10023093_17800 [Nemorincola caseinilytica]|uniref:RiboL-PSP-HEPN domain-containing protein n=1 Tax=Nemorincola caseinilytica TaxID=2054315 RepID=A0ABP8NHG3_9BACT